MLSNKEEYSLALIGKYRTELLGVATVMILFLHMGVTEIMKRCIASAPCRV